MRKAFVIDMDGRDKKYEYVLKRIYPTFRQARQNGAHALYMKNLIYTFHEQGAPGLPTYQEQFTKIQAYLLKAIDILLKWELSMKGKQATVKAKANLKLAVTIEDLNEEVSRMYEIIEGQV